MLFFARGNFLLDNMAVKKNARREIAETLKMLLETTGRILGTAGTGKPRPWIYQQKPTPSGVGYGF